uniref:Uncharacterized protein n=1 Tax=Arundo donax TaxID=35708 RepID=A0A0A9HNM5_ARUDO
MIDPSQPARSSRGSASGAGTARASNPP